MFAPNIDRVQRATISDQGSTDENNASVFFSNTRNLMSPDATSNRIAFFGNLGKSKTFSKKKGLDTTGPTGFKASGN